MVDSLAENFKMRLDVFRSRDRNIRDFENPFSVEISDVPNYLQLQVIEL
jgi:hypothetical protein